MKNIFYFKKISKIGGTEQFLYEMAKKYEDWDITVYYDEADPYQLKRLKQLVRCKKRIANEKVVCDRAYFNFNIDMIDDVESTDNYYAFVSHAIYQELGYKPPIDHPKLNHFIGVSQYSSNKLIEYGKIIGKEILPITCYDPLTIEPKEKVPILVSACRLDDKVKGGKRTIELIKALDRYCLKNNRHYLFLIFTNTTKIDLPSKNAVYMKPRVDVRPYIAMADYVVQLSNDMETFCYTTNEANSYGVPIVITPLSVYNELPVSDNEKIVLNWDCSNVDEVARLIFEKNVKPFTYKTPNDIWDKILAKGKSTYKEEKEMKVKVECVFEYFDLELNKSITPNDEDKNKYRIIPKLRAEEIIEKTNGAIKILEEVKEEKKEKAVKPTTKKEKAVK